MSFEEREDPVLPAQIADIKQPKDSLTPLRETETQFLSHWFYFIPLWSLLFLTELACGRRLYAFTMLNMVGFMLAMSADAIAIALQFVMVALAAIVVTFSPTLSLFCMCLYLVLPLVIFKHPAPASLLSIMALFYSTRQLEMAEKCEEKPFRGESTTFPPSSPLLISLRRSMHSSPLTIYSLSLSCLQILHGTFGYHLCVYFTVRRSSDWIDITSYMFVRQTCGHLNGGIHPLLCRIAHNWRQTVHWCFSLLPLSASLPTCLSMCCFPRRKRMPACPFVLFESSHGRHLACLLSSRSMSITQHPSNWWGTAHRSLSWSHGMHWR